MRERRKADRVEATSTMGGSAVIENVLSENSVELSSWALPNKPTFPI